jgi:hypothetical protein
MCGINEEKDSSASSSSSSSFSSSSKTSYQYKTLAKKKKEKTRKKHNRPFVFKNILFNNNSRTLRYYPIYNITFNRKKARATERKCFIVVFFFFHSNKKKKIENNPDRCCMCDKREKTGCENDKKKYSKDDEYHRTP